MSDDVQRFVERGLIERSASIVCAGPAEAVRAQLRAWLQTIGAAQGLNMIALCAADAPWDAAGQLGRSWLSVRVCGAECTPDQAARGALRMDPDLIVAEPGAVPSLEHLLACAETGHQVLAHLPDPAALERAPFPPGLALHLLVELDERGIARLTRPARQAGPGEVVWDRARPGPLPEELPGRAPPPPPAPPPAPEPLPAEVVERARAAVAGRLRQAWVPRLTDPAAPADAACSKLGGRPMLAAGEPWPGCPACGTALPLAAQLARAGLPTAIAARFPADAGWLQLFYCDSPGCSERDPAGARARNRVLRWLPAAGATPATVPDPLGDAAGRRWSPADVSGWDAHQESPHLEDLQPEAQEACREVHEHLAAREDARAAGIDLPEEALPEAELVALGGARAGDKLGGWPCWEQGAEWSTCRACDRRLEPLLQLDAWRGRLTALFAADGIGHLCACPEHPHELVFAWACG